MWCSAMTRRMRRKTRAASKSIKRGAADRRAPLPHRLCHKDNSLTRQPAGSRTSSIDSCVSDTIFIPASQNIQRNDSSVRNPLSFVSGFPPVPRVPVIGAEGFWRPVDAMDKKPIETRHGVQLVLPSPGLP